MIRTLRNSGFGQFFLGAIVVAIILAFVFTGAPSSSTSAGDECAVEVGKTCIAPKEFHASYRLLTSIGLNERAAKGLRLKEQVARGLAEREVLVEEAKRLGIATSEKNIDDELFEGRTRVSLPADGAERLAMNLAMCINGPTGCAPGTIGLRAISVTQGGKFDFNLYKRTVRVVSGRSPSHFKEMQTREYTAERVRQLVRSQVRVSPSEAFLAYSRARSKATARVAEVKTNWFQRYVTAPSQSQLDAWTKENQPAIDAMVKEKVAAWPVGCSVVAELRLDNADPASDKAKSVRESTEKLRTRLRAGESFDKIARAESHSDTASLGGRLGCLDAGYGAGSAALVEAAKSLQEKGTISPVIETIRGLHLLQLIGQVTEENRQELATAYVTYKLASEALAKEAARKFATDVIEKLQKGEPLADVLVALSQDSLATTPYAGADSPALLADNAPKSDISRALSIEQNPVPDATEGTPAVTLFALENEDDVADKPIATRSGFAVLQLKSKEMVTAEEFEDDRPAIMASLQKRKAEQALSTHVAQLISKTGGIKMSPKYIPPKEDSESDEGTKGTDS